MSRQFQLEFPHPRRQSLNFSAIENGNVRLLDCLLFVSAPPVPLPGTPALPPPGSPFAEGGTGRGSGARLATPIHMASHSTHLKACGSVRTSTLRVFPQSAPLATQFWHGLELSHLTRCTRHQSQACATCTLFALGRPRGSSSSSVESGRCGDALVPKVRNMAPVSPGLR